MKKIFILIFLAGVAFYGYSGYAKRHAFSMSDDSEGIKIIKGNNDFLFEDGGDFSVDLRVFGFNENKIGEHYGPLTLITHFFIASPMAENEAIFSRQMCESGSVNQASMLNIIVENEDVLKKIETIEEDKTARKCVRVAAKSLFLKRLLYDGEDITHGWRTTGKFRSDPYKYVLVSDIKQITCHAM